MIDEQENPDPAESEDAEGKNPSVATERGVRKQRAKKRTHEQLVGDFWKQVLADPVGRAEVWRILSGAGAFKPPFACGPTGFPQPEATWFKAGQQAMALDEYFRLLRIDPLGTLAMLQDFDPSFRQDK